MRNLRSGFTIIELMITLAVAAVLAILAAPTFSDLMIKSRLRGATDDIVTLLNTSRMNAVKLQRQINVSVNASAWCAGAVAEAGPTLGSGTAMTLANNPCDCSALTVACLVNSAPALVSSGNYPGVTLTAINSIPYVAGSGGVIFNPKLGVAYDSSGSLVAATAATIPTVCVTSGRFSTAITVSPLGQTNVCVPSSSPFVSGYPSCVNVTPSPSC